MDKFIIQFGEFISSLNSENFKYIVLNDNKIADITPLSDLRDTRVDANVSNQKVDLGKAFVGEPIELGIKLLPQDPYNIDDSSPGYGKFTYWKGFITWDEATPNDNPYFNSLNISNCTFQTSGSSLCPNIRYSAEAVQTVEEKPKVNIIKDTITYYVGDEVTPEQFLKDVDATSSINAGLTVDLSQVDFSNPSETTVEIKADGHVSAEVTVHVIEKEVSVDKHTVIYYVDSDIDEDQFLKDVGAKLTTAPGKVTSDFFEKVKLEEVGEYQVTIKAARKSIHAEAHVTVKVINRASLSADDEVTYYVDDDIEQSKFFEDVHVEAEHYDDLYSDFVEKVDFKKPGDYTVTITATDELEKVEKVVTVHVIEKEVSVDKHTVIYYVGSDIDEVQFLKDVGAKLTTAPGKVTSDFLKKLN